MASFEAPVKKGDGQGGFIDLLWKGVLLVEHKSRGKDLAPLTKGGAEKSPPFKKGDLGGFAFAIEAAAQGVLDARAKYMPTPFDSAQGAEPVGERSRTATLADLYDPLTMPPDLVKAHQALDRAVDAAYLGRDAKSCVSSFKTEAERVAFLFERHQQLTAPLVMAEKPTKKKSPKAQP